MQTKILSDIHLHSSFSGDSETPMEAMIQAGIQKGLHHMCFTEHLDLDYPYHPEDFVDFSLDEDSYRQTFLTLRDKYQHQIELLFGIELGLQPHLKDAHSQLLKKHPFDFVIGSSHTARGEDPYYTASFFQNRGEREAYTLYFTSILENLDAFSDIDTYGHIDYVVRYGPNRNKNYTYEMYGEVLDQILKTLIQKGIGMEVNSGGLKYSLGQPNPCEEIIRRYHQLGGKIITIGSDAHSPEYLAYEFPKISEILKSCGFTHYTIFRQRTPVFLPL